MFFRTCFVCLLVFTLYCEAYPVVVDSCGQPLQFNKRPTRMVTHDINITQMAFELKLQPYMAGVTGVGGWNKKSERFRNQQGNLPDLATKYASLENILLARTDLYFAGWGYGMRVGGPVTPDTLARYHINTLELTESCIRINRQKYPKASMSLLYDDLLRLGRVFEQENQTEQIIAQWHKRINKAQRLAQFEKPLKVFLYDSGTDKPLTAGKFAMPTALIEILGSKNIMDDIPGSWSSASWEVVAVRRPELIVLVDYISRDNVQNSIRFLENHPVMKFTPAVRNKRYVALSYAEVTPGPANIEAIEKLAQAIKGE